MRRGFTASFISIVACVALSAGSVPALAAPPSPKLIARAKKDARLARKLADTQALMRAKGIDRPRSAPLGRRRSAPKGTTAGDRSAAGAVSAALSGQVRALAILVDFSDKTSSVGAASFDSLLFADVTGPTSVRGYYREVSYGMLDLVTVHLPSATGWRRLPQTYAYYVNNNYGVGSYPQNAQKMVEDAIDAADPLVDFSQYDGDGDGRVDALFVVHSGRGAEYTGSTADMWSHQWAVPWTGRNVKDGTRIWEYSTEPEYWVTPGDMTVGVYAHELGHVFGLPDLYDRDYSSMGVGDWSLMAGGSWNGFSSTGGDRPSRPDAWSAVQLGFNTPRDVTSTIESAVISPVNTQSAGSIYRIRPWGAATGSEYFMVENRRKTGTDAAAPGQGLLVWHIDESVGHNDDETHYMVDLEEAHGGVQNLARHDGQANQGDAGDVFPGTTDKRLFWADSDPGSRLYGGGDSGFSLSSISGSATTMTARFGMGLGLADGNDDVPGETPTASPVAGTLASGPDSDDVFAVELWAGQTVAATLTGAGGTDFDLFLFGPGTTSVRTDAPLRSAQTAGYPETLSHQATSSGVHYLDVRAVSGSGAYTLAFSVAASPDDTDPPEPVGGFTASAGDAQATLSWTNPDTDYASTRVLRSGSAFAGSPAGAGSQTVVYEGTDTGKLDTGLGNGTTYFYTAFARDAAGNWSVASTASAVPQAPPPPPQATVLTAYRSPSTVGYGGSGTAYGTLKTLAGVAIPLRGDVLLWRRGSRSGSVWQEVGPAAYQLSGGYAGYYAEGSGPLTSSTWFQLRFPGGGAYEGSDSSAVLLKARAWLPTPSTPSSARRGRSMTTSGYLKPAHWSTTRLEYYRYSGGAWRLYRYRLAKNTNRGSYSRYARKDVFSSSGRYRVRARHWDADHDRTYSGWRYFSVR